MAKCLQFIKEHPGYILIEIARKYSLEPQQVLRRLKNPTIGWRQDNHQPVLLSSAETIVIY